jgi:DNA-binding IclR family transcriptional regulator
MSAVMDMPVRDGSIAAVKSADRVLDILELLARAGRPMSHGEIKSVLGLPGSSLTHLLRTLIARDYIRFDPARASYDLGESLVRLARARRNGLDIRALAQTIVERIGKATGESTSFLMLRRGEVERVAGINSTKGALRFVTTLGVRLPAHSVAGGKVMLALLPGAERGEHLSQISFERMSSNTITSRADFEARLAKIAKDRYAHSLGEYDANVVGTAVPVIDGRGFPVGALSVVIPKFRDSVAYRAELRRVMFAAAADFEKMLTGD